MKSCNFTYHDPQSISDAVTLVANYENAKVLAGGQSLVPMMNLRVVTPEHIIDLNGVTELFGVTENKGGITIGAMTRQTSLLNSTAVQHRFPIISQALSFVGHDQTRNRGTIGGSLCHLDPAAELCISASVYEAELTVTSNNGDRVIAISDWPVDFLTPSVRSDEILTKIQLKNWQEPHGFSFMEFARREGDFAVVAVAVLLGIENNIITRASIVLGGVSSGPVKLSDVETLVTGGSPSTDLFREAGELASKVDAISDINYSTKYRQRLARVLTERALRESVARYNRSIDGNYE